MQWNADKRNRDHALSSGETIGSETSVNKQPPDTHNESKENPPIPQQLVQEEETQAGSVSSKVYWAYATAVAGGAFIPVYVLSQISIEVLDIVSSYWMAWGSSSSGQVSVKVLIWVYSLLGASVTVFVLVAAVTASVIGFKAAQKYFLFMLRSVFRAPMSFFDSTPSGRITSRVCAPLHIPFLMFKRLLSSCLCSANL